MAPFPEGPVPDMEKAAHAVAESFQQQQLHSRQREGRKHYWSQCLGSAHLPHNLWRLSSPMQTVALCHMCYCDYEFVSAHSSVALLCDIGVGEAAANKLSIHSFRQERTVARLAGSMLVLNSYILCHQLPPWSFAPSISSTIPAKTKHPLHFPSN